MVELEALPNLISIKESIHMELVKGLLEKYPSTHEEVQEALDNADTGSSNDSKIKKLMKQNEYAARSVAEGGNGKKALKTKRSIING